MKLLKKPLLALGMLVAFSASNAELPQSFDYKKASANYVDNTSSAGNGVSNPIYFGGTIGPSDGSTYCSGTSNCEDSDSAWKLFGGYRLSERLSIEGAYVSLGDFYKKGENSDISALTANAVGTIPVTEKFDIFGKLGVMRWSSDNTDDDESGFGVTYGIGTKMRINETTSLRAEWEKFPGIETSSSEDTDVNMLSVGIELSTY